MKYKQRKGHWRAAIVITGLVVVALAGLWWHRSQQSTDQVPQGEQGLHEASLKETVDRGFSEDDWKIMQERIAEKQQEIAEADERDIHLLLEMGNLYYTAGELAKAVEQYDDILSTHPNDVPALENKGQALLEMGDHAGAESAWLKAISLNAQETTYLKLVELYKEHMPEKYNRGAGPVLEEAVANIGQTTGLMVALGAWYKDQGKWDRAISHYEVATRLSPENDILKEELEELRKEKNGE